MNRRILVAIALSFITVWALQYFTKKDAPAGPGGKVAPGQVQSGQFYQAPVQQSWHKEPKREIDFVDITVTQDKEEVVKIDNPLYELEFSNFGGVIKSLSFKNHKGKDGNPINSIKADTLNQKEEGCFLLALDEKSPYVYQLVSHKKNEGGSVVTYKTTTQDWVINKIYTIHDQTYRIDVAFEFVPTRKNPKPINPRLFFPSPNVPEISENIVSGFTTKNGTKITKIGMREELGGVWGLPEIFGAEDKYFVHTLIKDSTSFSQGGYYKRVNKKLFSILEGQQIKDKKRVSLSFYIGPKLLKDLSIVDERLEDLLSFGWLSWICKMLLRLLEFLQKHIKNFGLAIILLTILLKLPFVPLSISSRKKMEEYQKYQPTINRIRAKYKTDMRKQQEEIVRFHKEHNLSAATPMIGCLPLIIQLPILFALYRVLGNYLSLYQAPFFGWITDLSAKDPYYVLPILMGATMLWQQRMSPVSDSKQRVMMMFLPIVMTAIFSNFPAGLVLYWFVNNFLTVMEDVLRKKVFS